MPNQVIEAGERFTEEHQKKSTAEFKRNMEALYKDYVGRLKTMSRAEENWALKNKQVLKQFSDTFKEAFTKAGANLREFAEYQSRMMRELSAAHSKVDFGGDYLASLKVAYEKSKELHRNEIVDLSWAYKRKMRMAEDHRQNYYRHLESAEFLLEESNKAKNKADQEFYKNGARLERERAKKSLELMQGITEEAKQEVDDRLKIYKKEAEAVAELNKQFNQRGGKNPLADASENIATAADMMTGGLGDFLSKLKNRDLKGIGESLSKAGDFGRTLEGRGTQKGAGASAKVFGMIGKLLKSFGPALRIFGALAKGFANVISFIIDIESAGKQLNKAFLESASGADALVNTLGDESVSLNASLRDIREGVNDLYLSQGLGVTAEAAMGMVAEFQAAGITLKEMKGAMTDAKDSEAAYVKVIQHMTAQQRILGASVEDVASITERYGYSLEDIAVRFAAITDQAMQSGFGVKRFYSMVLQATTGMGVYNTRIEEAAFFATRLGKILGARGLEESGLLKKLAQGFKGQGVKENYKAMMMMGDKARKEIFSQEYGARVGNVSRSKDQGKLLAEAFKTAGLGEVDTSNEKALSKALRSVSVEERSRLLAAIRQQDGGSDMAVGLAKEIGQILQLHVGTQGRSGGAVSAGALGMTGFLKAQQAMMKRFGLTDVRQLNTDSQASIVYRSFLEEQMGYSGEQTDSFIAAIDGLRGDFDLLQREGKADTTDKKIAQIEKYGAYIDKQGKLIQAQYNKDTGKIVGEKDLGKASFDAFMRLNEGVLTKATEQRDRNLELSEQIANNTVDIAQRIEMGVTYFLQGIYSTLDSILNFFVGGNLDSTGKKRAQELYGAYDRAIKTLEKQIEETRKEESEVAKDKDLHPEEREKRIAAIRGKREKLDEGLAKVRAGKDDLREKIATKHEATIEDLNQGWGNTIETNIPYLETQINNQVKEAEKQGKVAKEGLTVNKEMKELLKDIKDDEQVERAFERLVSEGYSGEEAMKILKRVKETKGFGQGFDRYYEHREAAKRFTNLATPGSTLPTASNVGDPKVKPSAGDFVYQGDGYGNGVVTPINSFDRAMGVVYGKPNGVFDRAGRFGGAGGRGGNSNVIINIMGDPITVTRTVRKVLAAEKSRGLGGGGRTSSLYS
jgi:hypothetical protein